MQYQGHRIDPLSFWAMMFGTAAIDSSGREINTEGQPIMSDKFRFPVGGGKGHRRWPLYDIYDLSTARVIDQKEYSSLPNGRKLDCDFRPYLSVTQNGKERYRVYTKDTKTIAELIHQSILDGNAPIIRVLKELHGEDEHGNRAGLLYQYRDTILDAVRQAIKLGPYWNTGINELLLKQLEKGYISSVEQYQLVWFLSIRDGGLSDLGIRDLGVAELETLRQFVQASEEELYDWFGQQLDSLRWAGGDHFPAIIDGEIRYDRKYYPGVGPIQSPRYINEGDFLDGQLAYLSKKFRPGVVRRLHEFFYEYSGILKESLAPEEVQEGREALEAAVQAFNL